MQFEMKPYELPVISFNYETLKAEVERITSDYKTLQFAEGQEAEASKTLADLRKLSKAIDDERKRVKKDAEAPIKAFEAQVKEITGVIEKAIASIKAQVDEFEINRRSAKLELVQQIFAETGFQSFVQLGQIYSDKWLNKTVTEKQIREEMQSIKHRIGNDVLTISRIVESDAVMVFYRESLDLTRAIEKAEEQVTQAKKIEEQKKARAEAEAVRRTAEHGYSVIPPLGTVAEVKEEPKKWLAFRVLLETQEQAAALDKCMRDNGIRFEFVEG